MGTRADVTLCAPAALELPDLRDVVGDAVTTVQPVRHSDVRYFDTDDLRLTRWGIALSHDAGARTDPWTVEWHDRSDDDRTRLAVDLPGTADEIPDAALDLVRAFVRGAPLAPVAQLSTTRRPVAVRDHHGRVLAEVVDDLVAVSDGGPLRSSLRTIDIVNRVDGRAGRELVHRAAQRLVAAGCQEGARPVLVRALGRAAEGQPDVAVPELAPHSRLEPVLRAVLARPVLDLLRHDPGIRLGDEPEPVHELRAATRRLRADLSTFAPLLVGERVAAWRIDLRWLGDVAGAVRSCDVVTRALRTELTSLVGDDRRDADRLLDRLATQHGQARSELLAALRSTRYDRFLDDLVVGSADPPFAHRRDEDRRAAPVLRRLVEGRWRRLEAAADRLGEDPSDAALHEVRILAKGCRYAADAATLVLGAPAQRFAEAVGRVQHVLGDLQDTVADEAWLRATAEADPASALIAGELIARCQARRAAYRREWPVAWRTASAAGLRRWLCD